MTASRGLLDRLLTRPLPGLDHPVSLRFTPDGSALTFLQAPPGSDARALWRLELASGARRLLADPDHLEPGARAATLDDDLDRQRRRETGRGITRYRAAEDADLLALTTAGACHLSIGGEAVQRLPEWDDVQEAIPAPGGTWLALVVAGDVWVVALDGTGRRLTTTAGPGRYSGLAEYIAAEELDRFDGLWWSHDGATLAWASVDERRIPEVVVSSAVTDGGRPEVHRYPFAGGPNAQVTLMVARVDVPSGTEVLPGARAVNEVPLEIGDGYLARVVPHPHGGWLAAVLPHDQRALRWWRVGPSGSADQLWEERADPWINLDDATHVLADGSVLRATEATGPRHLELRSADGALVRRLTAGSWVVTELVHVDEARNEALVLGTADGTLERHCYAIPLDPTAPVEHPARITIDPGWHEVVFSRDGRRWTDTWSSRRSAPAVVVRSRDGEAPVSVHTPSATAESLEVTVPELIEITAGDGTTPLTAALFHPPPDTSTVPPPAVIWVYGGPHSQHVREAWTLTMHPLRQALAAAGFLVAMVDGRGTANRGLAFEAPIAGAFGTVELDDQVAMVQELARRGTLDPARVGITGSSYGGYMVLRALGRRPDLFRAGCAGSPVVSWRRYDTAYTERYLGAPALHPEAYEAASIPGEGAAFGDELLVVHGTLDENVHPAHTHDLAAAMSTAGRELSVTWLDAERHVVQSREASLRRDRLAIAHLCGRLGVPLPADLTPAVFAADREGTP